MSVTWTSRKAPTSESSTREVAISGVGEGGWPSPLTKGEAWKRLGWNSDSSATSKSGLTAEDKGDGVCPPQRQTIPLDIFLAILTGIASAATVIGLTIYKIEHLWR